MWGFGPVASLCSGAAKKCCRISSRKARFALISGLCFLITTMLSGQSHSPPAVQEVSTKAPPGQMSRDGGTGEPAAAEAGDRAGDARAYPTAKLIEDEADGVLLTIESDGPQSKSGSHYVLDGNVVVTYGERRVEADHIEFDTDTGDLTATGHLRATGGANHEVITASHGTLNVKSETGRFYDVTGSVGMRGSGKRLVYASSNPFLFSGRLVVKTGPQEYEVFDGTVTSCRLPRPDWLLSAGEFNVDGDRARARNSVFHLLNVPLMYLPYVTHPLDEEARQSGFLIPVIGQSSTKGLILGEQIYFAINRSSDLTVGTEYYSMRGWAQMANFRYRGRGDNFLQARYSGLLDRLPANLNQGGEDALFAGRYDFSPETRVAANVEYLSSYIYREAFTENFNQAVSTDITSIAYAVHHQNGYETALEADRYQGLKRQQSTLVAGQQVRLFHVPSLDFSATDHAVSGLGLLWNAEASAAGLKRVQPNFATGGVVERLDLRPELLYPLHLGGWDVLPGVAVEETLYSRSRASGTGVAPGPGGPPMQLTGGLSRSDLDVHVDVRAPVLERTFRSPAVEHLFGGEVRHTIEPEVHYRYVTGINNFGNVLRFDDRDVVSNTNEVEYGVTQRLFLRGGTRERPCAELARGALGSGVHDSEINSAEMEEMRSVGDASAGCVSHERISWRLAQKYFFDPTFGGAVVRGRRNIFETTLDFSGVAFLTEPRSISPLVSRLRVHTSDKVDFEWDFDLDTGAKKFTSNNLLVDAHQGNGFVGLSYARLNAPGRFSVEGVSTLTPDFNQLRVLLGYGTPAKRGLSVAANAGLDLNLTSLQYAALQTSYNWDCCGLSVEYRKYELGSVRNENAYRFNFTLANIGTAGNLRRAERLF